MLNGIVAKNPGVEFIVPHAGATLPMVADRVHVFSRLLDVDPTVDVLRDLGRLHFDLAGFPVPRQLDALLTLTTLDHLHYGSDYPFTPEFRGGHVARPPRPLARTDECGKSAARRTPNEHRATLPVVAWAPLTARKERAWNANSNSRTS